MYKKSLAKKGKIKELNKKPGSAPNTKKQGNKHQIQEVNPFPIIMTDQNIKSYLISSKENFDLIISWIKERKYVTRYRNIQLSLIYKPTITNEEKLPSLFHEKCDNKGPTLTLIKTKNNNILGGYTQESWDESSEYKADKNAFIFDLKNQIVVKTYTEFESAIYCSKLKFPSFGKYDLFIGEKCFEDENDNYLKNNLNKGLKNPETGSNFDKNPFILQDLEVYQVSTVDRTEEEIKKIKEEEEKYRGSEDKIISELKWINEEENKLKLREKKILEEGKKDNLLIEKFSENYYLIISWMKGIIKSKKINLNLLYKASNDGKEPSKFHEKCDNKGSTITIIETSNKILIGGYTEQSWEGNEYKQDNSSFIFNLENKKIFKHNNNFDRAIYTNPNYFPSFGDNELMLDENCFNKNSAKLKLNCNDYNIPKGGLKVNRVFRLKELEVYNFEEGK